jgi:hypothetical protein
MLRSNIGPAAWTLVMSVAPYTERSDRGINDNKHNRAIEQRTLRSIGVLFGIQVPPCFFDWFAAAVMNGI